jgi:hypothetical protein
MFTHTKLGYYQIGDDIFTHSKLEAIELHAATGHYPRWDFNDAVYSSYDWTVEPAESILELYKQRAEQLRNQYDYIILFYSGGADSQSVLDSFLLNNIHIDELATFTNYEATGDKQQYFNSETFNVVLPKVEQLKVKFPLIKHRMIDLMKPTLDFFSDKKNKFDWIYNSNMFFTPNCVAKNDLPLRIPEWNDMITSGKKVCLLWGHDKPRITQIDGKFCFRFIDLIDNGPTVKSMSGLNPYTEELFYWSPDLPKLVIKQSHLIMNYLKQYGDSSPFVSEERSDLACIHKDGKIKWLSNHGVHNIIYPKWDINTFSAGKPNSIIASPRDNWFTKLEEPNLSREIWLMGIDKLWKLLPDFWKNDPNDINKGLMAQWSRTYFMEK